LSKVKNGIIVILLIFIYELFSIVTYCKVSGIERFLGRTVLSLPVPYSFKISYFFNHVLFILFTSIIYLVTTVVFIKFIDKFLIKGNDLLSKKLLYITKNPEPYGISIIIILMNAAGFLTFFSIPDGFFLNSVVISIFYFFLSLNIVLAIINGIFKYMVNSTGNRLASYLVTFILYELLMIFVHIIVLGLNLKYVFFSSYGFYSPFFFFYLYIYEISDYSIWPIFFVVWIMLCFSGMFNILIS